MNFKSAMIKLDGGRVLDAREEDGKICALVRRNGAVEKVTVDKVSKAVKQSGALSYAAECLPTLKGCIEKMGDMYFVENV